MTGTIDITDRYGYQGIVRLRVFDVADLRAEWSLWDHFSDTTKLRATRLLEAKQQVVVENQILNNFYTSVNKHLDRNDTGSGLSASHIAIGDNSTSVSATADTMNNEVYRTLVGQTDQSGTDLITSSLIGQAEAVGEDIKEVALAPGPDPTTDSILTHTALPSGSQVTNKSSGEAVTIDYTLIG